MNIAFRIDISNEIGTGHLMRMSALAYAFEKLGNECFFFKSEDEPIDFSKFEIVILDTYQVTDEYIEALNAPCRTTVCYDDNALYTYSCDVLLNANLHAKELRFKFGRKIPQLLLGGEFALLRSEFQDSYPFKVRKTANSVFVCFGGSDLRNMTPGVVNVLKGISGIQLHVVLGAYAENGDVVNTLANQNVFVYRNPKSISAIMRDCDVAVTSAGSMVYELAAVGIPAITIVQADNQLLIADYLSRNNLMSCAGKWESVNYKDLANDVSSLLSDYDRRINESKRLLTSVNKNGAVRAAESIVEIAKKTFFLV